MFCSENGSFSTGCYGCGGGGGDSAQSESPESPEWLEEVSETSTRYIYEGTLMLNGVIFVPEKIPVDQPMTRSNANFYEIRTNKTNLDVTKYSYTWNNQAGEIRNYTSVNGFYYADFSENLRSERLSLIASTSSFIAYGVDGLEQVNCTLAQEGESTCDAYGAFFAFQDLDYPLVTGVQNIDYAVELEKYLLTAMFLN